MLSYHIDCTKFTRDNIVGLLLDRGYKNAEKIFFVKYDRTSGGNVRYIIKYNEDQTFPLLESHVYVFIDTDGKLVCDF